MFRLLHSKGWEPVQAAGYNIGRFLSHEEAAHIDLAGKMTHIDHDAWYNAQPICITRVAYDSEKQFTAMRNLVNLARDAEANLPARPIIEFQIASPIEPSVCILSLSRNIWSGGVFRYLDRATSCSVHCPREIPVDYVCENWRDDSLPV